MDPRNGANLAYRSCDTPDPRVLSYGRSTACGGLAVAHQVPRRGR
jgi:hypothetical protein